MRSAQEPPDAADGSSVPPPVVFCPTCARPLTFRGMFTRPVDAGERWSEYECHSCGRYEFRSRRDTEPQAPG